MKNVTKKSTKKRTTKKPARYETIMGKDLDEVAVTLNALIAEGKRVEVVATQVSIRHGGLLVMFKVGG